MQNYIIELESKVQILEHENEVLSSTAQENLLLIRIFEEINTFENLNDIFYNTLENTSILLDIQFAAVFQYTKGVFSSIQSYSLNCTDDSPIIKLHVDKADLLKLLFEEKQFIHSPTLKLENLNTTCIHFDPEVFFTLPLKTKVLENIIFVFADREAENLNDSKQKIIGKILDILSLKIERIYYQAELEKVNKLLKETNQKLIKTNKELNISLRSLKETQLQLLQSEKMASLGTLTAGIAHEINNPLNYLMGAYAGLSDYFEEHGSMEKEKTDVLLNSINVGIDRISGILQGLNQFSRNNESMDEDCNIHSILDNCFVMLQNESRHKTDIIKDYTPEQIIIKGNVGKLHQVFLNVLTNSIQAIPEKGNIVTKTRIKEKKAFIEIKDTGIGIEKKNLKMITDPFFTTKPPGKGTGLGLSITYSIVKELGGTLEIESTPNKGTKVIISLPLK